MFDILGAVVTASFVIGGGLELFDISLQGHGWPAYFLSFPMGACAWRQTSVMNISKLGAA